MDSAPSLPMVPPPLAPDPVPVTPPARPVFPAVPGGWLRRLGGRFVTSFWILFCLDRVVGLLPGSKYTWLWINQVWRWLAPWFGHRILQIPDKIVPAASGSGDTLYNWVDFWTRLSVAGLVALVWVWFDRARRGDGWTNEAMRVALRYSLGATMLSYGMAKILHQQMSPPGSYRLLEPYGEFSPMGVVWTFMGQSPVYGAIAGWLEFSGGALLFFRRTTTLGALVLVVVMTNVFLLNMCFDVPVKLYSGLYLLMALTLVAPAIRQLWDVLLRHCATVAAPVGAASRPWLTRGPASLAVSGAKYLLVLSLLWSTGGERALAAWAAEAPPVPRSPWAGLWEVKSFARDGVAQPPLLTDARRWRELLVSVRGDATLVYMDGHKEYFHLVTTPAAARVRLQALSMRALGLPAGQAVPPSLTFSYLRPAPADLQLESAPGVTPKLSVSLRSNPDKVTVINREFRWVAERPYNK